MKVISGSVLLCFQILWGSIFSQGACDSLIIDSVHISALTDSILIVSVTNNSSELFDYPGFKVFNEDGDLIAQEEVGFFGISQTSQHCLFHTLEGIPESPQQLTLELWTGFYDELACTFIQEFMFIPEEGCSEVAVWVSDGPYTIEELVIFEILDEDGNAVVYEEWQFPSQFGFYNPVECLEQGCYTLQLSTTDAAISNELSILVSNICYQPVILDTTEVGSAFYEIAFSVWQGCPTEVELEEYNSGIHLFPNPAATIINIPDAAGSAIELRDLSGKLIDSYNSQELIQSIDLSNLTPGMYFVKTNLSKTYKFIIE